MKTLKEDWQAQQDCDPKAHGVNPLEIKGVTISLTHTDNDGFMIRFNVPNGGTWSEPVSDYKDFYEVLGRIFVEENGIIDNLLCKGTIL